MPVLNHIAVYVKDLKKSADFYTRIIGLDTIPEPFHDGRPLLRLDEAQVARRHRMGHPRLQVDPPRLVRDLDKRLEDMDHDGIDQGIVPMTPNYEGSTEEPMVLPAATPGSAGRLVHWCTGS